MTPRAKLPNEWVYRCFDGFGNLLYIGQTAYPSNRVSIHKGKTPWWSEVVRTEWEQHPDRASAVRAERVAILAEDPIHNVRRIQPR